jgi:hypothetical protein
VTFQCRKTSLVWKQGGAFYVFNVLVMPLMYEGIPLLFDDIYYAANDERFQQE